MREPSSSSTCQRLKSFDIARFRAAIWSGVTEELPELVTGQRADAILGVIVVFQGEIVEHRSSGFHGGLGPEGGLNAQSHLKRMSVAGSAG